MSDEQRTQLTLDEIKARLRADHNTVIPDDDPVLMLVTIHNAFLEQYDTLFSRHGAALTAYLRDLAAQVGEEIQAHRKAVLDKAVRASIEHVLAEIAHHEQAMTTTREALERLAGRIFWLTYFSGFAALLSIAGAIWRWT